MPQHVGMDWKRHFGGRPKPRHHPAKGNCGHRSAALAHEDISSGFLFSLETAQGAKFGCSQAMPECHQNHGGVTMPVPIVSRRLHEPFNLALGEVLASAIFGIRQPTARDCSLYSGWGADARS